MNPALELFCFIERVGGAVEPCRIAVSHPVDDGEGLYQASLSCPIIFTQEDPVYAGDTPGAAVAHAVMSLAVCLRGLKLRLLDRAGKELSLPDPREFDPDYPTAAHPPF